MFAAIIVTVSNVILTAIGIKKYYSDGPNIKFAFEDCHNDIKIYYSDSCSFANLNNSVKITVKNKGQEPITIKEVGIKILNNDIIAGIRRSLEDPIDDKLTYGKSLYYYVDKNKLENAGSTSYEYIAYVMDDMGKCYKSGRKSRKSGDSIPNN